MRALLFLACASLPLAAQKPTVPDIHPDSVLAIAKRIKSVRAKPTTITIKVGQVVSLDAITVTAIDSSGRVRGRLTGYDFANIPPGEAARVEPRKITGVHPGTTALTVRYPRIGWKNRTDPRPEAKVTVVVTP